MSRHNPKRVRIWRELIDAWTQSGQSVNAFCRDRKLTRSNFDRWRRILATKPGESAHGKPSAAAFVLLRLVAEPMVEVVLCSGIVVRLPLGAAPEAVNLLTWDGLVLGGGMSLDELLMSLEAIPRRKLTDKDWRGDDRHEKLVPGFWTRGLS